MHMQLVCVCVCVWTEDDIGFALSGHWSIWKDSDNELTFLLCKAAWEICYGNDTFNSESTFS